MSIVAMRVRDCRTASEVSVSVSDAFRRNMGVGLSVSLGWGGNGFGEKSPNTFHRQYWNAGRIGAKIPFPFPPRSLTPRAGLHAE